MAKIYVYHGAVGGANGTTWADAYITIQAALTVWTTSDEIWMAHDHAESSSSLTLTAANDSQLTPVPIYRMNRTTNVYAPSPLDQTDTINITVASTASDINLSVFANWHGVRFRGGDAFVVSSNFGGDFFDCDIEYAYQSAAEMTMFNCTRTRYYNCTVRAANFSNNKITTKQTIDLQFIGCTFAIDNLSTGLVEVSDGLQDTLTKFIDCDLSGLVNNTLVFTSDMSGTAANETQVIYFISCKLKAGYALWDNTLDARDCAVYALGCSTDDTAYINDKREYHGAVDTSTTVYFTDGYEDIDADTPLSQEVTPSSSRCNFHTAIESFPISGIISDTGAKVFTVEMIENFTTALTARECWLELRYYDNASNVNQAIDLSGKEYAALTYTDLAAGAGLASWIAEPAGSRSVKLTASVTLAKAGYYEGIVHVGKYEAGKVVHINPQFGIA